MSPELGQKVIAIAQGLVGSHYINGAYGATPGSSDGCPCRPGLVDLIADENHLDPRSNSKKPVNLAVNAATMSVKTYCVCAGNYATSGGSATTETDPDLVAYLASLKGTQPSSWQNYNAQFTPRRTFGPGQNGGDGGGKLVWGLSCKGIRHFDCVGFISYCYWKASGAVTQQEISGWRTPTKWGDRQVFDFSAGERPAALADGDIIVKADHHIAYVDDSGTIIEAQDSHLGVCSTPGFRLDSPGTWTHLVRLTGGGSAELAWPMGWWRVWDGNTWYYYLGPDGVAMSSKTSPVNTRKPPANAYNTGTWASYPPNTLVVTWKLRPGAPMPCQETFYNASDGCTQMNANSNLYSPLVATQMA